MQKNCCLQGKEVLRCSEGFLRSEFLITCLFLRKIQVRCVNHSSHWLWAEITVVTLVVPQNPEPIIFGYFITNALAGLGIHCDQTIERLSIQSLCGCSIHVIVDILQNWAHCAILILQIVIGQRQNFTSWQAAFIQHPLFCNRNGNPAICFGCTNYKRAVDGGMGCQ